MDPFAKGQKYVQTFRVLMKNASRLYQKCRKETMAMYIFNYFFLAPKDLYQYKEQVLHHEHSLKIQTERKSFNNLLFLIKM